MNEHNREQGGEPEEELQPAAEHAETVEHAKAADHAEESEPQEEAAVAEQESEADDVVLSEVELNEVIENLCLSKVEEFKMLGYEHVSGKDVWNCVSDKYRKSGIPPLHQIVNDILSLKSTQFMNWMTMSAYKGAQFF